jgi:hypothetical protein
MSEEFPLNTQVSVDDVMIPLARVLRLSVEDTPADVIQKGLYRAAADQIVAIFSDESIVGVASADRLRSVILPRTWEGQLGRWLRNLSRPPTVLLGSRVVQLLLLAVEYPEIDWLVVVDYQEPVPQPLGVLSRATILEYRPPVSFDTVALRGMLESVYGNPNRPVDAYYCEIEGRIVLPDEVHTDQQGRQVDDRGHPVKKYDSR